MSTFDELNQVKATLILMILWKLYEDYIESLADIYAENTSDSSGRSKSFSLFVKSFW
jgi:hypothetical protein